MRIARIIEYFPPHVGGMEGHGLTISFEQAKSGHTMEVFNGYGYKEWEDSKYFHINQAPLQFLPLYSKARRFWFNIWAYFTIKRNHKKNPYNIIHIHGDFMEAYFGGKLSKKIKVPAILTIHAGLNKRLLKPKNAKYFENISKIICVSEEIVIDLKSIGIPENKLAVISSGINLIEFNNEKSNSDEYKKEVSDLRDKYLGPILISVGVLRISKGFKYLIEAYKILEKKYSSLTLLILGDGPEYDNLKIEATNFSRIHFLGSKNLNKHEEVIRYLKAADFFILPSIDLPQDREGTPTSIMEAMASGLPIIATKVGGVPYLIKEGANGFLVNPGNPEELAGAVIKLINNPDFAKKMGAQNLEDIKQKDWPDIAKLVIKIYESVLLATYGK